FFALDVLDNRAFGFRGHNVDLNRSGLAEPPTTTDGLILLFVRVREAYKCHARASLPVDAIPGDGWFRYEDPYRPFGKIENGLLFMLGRVRSPNLNSIRNSLRQCFGFRVEV